MKDCDCFTNFVGANHQLENAVKLFSWSKENNINFQNSSTQNTVNFHFNTPASSYQGMLWKGAVKSMKYHLWCAMEKMYSHSMNFLLSLLKLKLFSIQTFQLQHQRLFLFYTLFFIFSILLKAFICYFLFYRLSLLSQNHIWSQELRPFEGCQRL